MGSTFMGLETSKRGLTTQQSALYTTGHNISNANTLGYSRQRVNMEATIRLSRNRSKCTKNTWSYWYRCASTDLFNVFVTNSLTANIVKKQTNLATGNARSNAISQMEDIMAEPSDYGLNESLDQFWKSLQDLSASPENAGARKVVVQKGIAVAESFNYITNQLTQIQENLAK